MHQGSDPKVITDAKKGTKYQGALPRGHYQGTFIHYTGNILSIGQNFSSQFLLLSIFLQLSCSDTSSTHDNRYLHYFIPTKAIMYNLQIFRNFYPKGVNMIFSHLSSDRTNSKTLRPRPCMTPVLYDEFWSCRVQFKQQIMKLNEVYHLIIYCLNCIRRDQNSTYKTGLRS